jgi:hypothetical protein
MSSASGKTAIAFICVYRFLLYDGEYTIVTAEKASGILGALAATPTEKNQ